MKVDVLMNLKLNSLMHSTQVLLFEAFEKTTILAFLFGMVYEYGDKFARNLFFFSLAREVLVKCFPFYLKLESSGISFQH